ncbi:MAG TPA: hypothetical protein VN635_01210 [Conexibacter sp.]|nr:hypothetical protein [Conexibacter sp.]
MRTHRLIPLSLLALLAAGVAGCGVANPYAKSTPTLPSATTATSPANPGEGGPGTVPVAEPPASALAASPTAALAAFARGSVNWSWRTLAATDRALAAMSVGAARQRELQAAAQVAVDDTLQRARTTSSGTVVAVAPARGAPAGTYVVVTRQQLGVGSSDALATAPALHVALARAMRQGDGWVVSAWQPQT